MSSKLSSGSVCYDYIERGRGLVHSPNEAGTPDSFHVRVGACTSMFCMQFHIFQALQWHMEFFEVQKWWSSLPRLIKRLCSLGEADSANGRFFGCSEGPHMKRLGNQGP